METELNLENLLEDHPLYWVNALRGRVTKRLMVKLQATLLAQGNAFLDQFIKYNGISCLLDVHEDLFWRTFEPKDKHKEHAIDLHEAKEAFLECTACLLPLLRRPMGLKAFTEGSKKTLHQQIVLLATSLANPEVRKVCLWAIHMIVSHCPISRMGDLTSAFHEGLVSLQPLMAEPSIFATSLRIIAEAESTGDLESTVHALYLLNVSVEGVGDDPHESKHLKTRERMRTAFESAGLPALLDKLQHKVQPNNRSALAPRRTERFGNGTTGRPGTRLCCGRRRVARSTDCYFDSRSVSRRRTTTCTRPPTSRCLRRGAAPRCRTPVTSTKTPPPARQRRGRGNRTTATWARRSRPGWDRTLLSKPTPTISTPMRRISPISFAPPREMRRQRHRQSRRSTLVRPAMATATSRPRRRRRRYLTPRKTARTCSTSCTSRPRPSPSRPRRATVRRRQAAKASCTAS
ncbi:uncharacterized protein ACA1_036500 [Acanthamoeba castellanii str. Neff]|uniref:Uncharacterized protein n=1 Tax=Acanthamoeba castellanii (strain ATCC 30010 / Neff) TaxID=1257118 RepID=L8HCJ1_ACACF|nr:uncharacterized protein ACA1_036500 [Acanthamoeba castellanii str. Neff]ELR22957.1 hypothetical protein ACA1_036500 [Acanthamoeba castellanii str. Neff]